VTSVERSKRPDLWKRCSASTNCVANLPCYPPCFTQRTAARLYGWAGSNSPCQARLCRSHEEAPASRAATILVRIDEDVERTLVSSGCARSIYPNTILDVICKSMQPESLRQTGCHRRSLPIDRSCNPNQVRQGRKQMPRHLRVWKHAQDE
jgi:hypothetical protein